jgi:hypothetical protein
MKKSVLSALAISCALLMFAGAQPAQAANPSKPKCTITGTAADDVLTGTSANDVICGLGGNDVIQGGGGKDIIFGGSGKDMIFGGAGNDKIAGGPGNDMISGGRGKDSIATDQGSDTCAFDRQDIMLDECKLDKAAPKITVAGAKIQRVEAGTTAYFRWNATDASGIEESWLSIGGASGWVTKWCGFIVTSTLVEGTAKDGVFEAKCDIPKTAPNLEYSVFLSSRDYLGNISNSDSAITFEVFGGSSDVEAPTFELISKPTQVAAGSTFQVTWRSVDATDVAYGALYFAFDGYSFSDGFVQYISTQNTAQLLNGDDKDGTYTQTFLVNSDAPAGRYTLWSTRADSLGNKVFDQTSFVVEVTR